MAIEGNFDNFLKYLYEYQFRIATTLFLNEKTSHLSSLPFKLLVDHADILNDNRNCVATIDSILKIL